MLSTGQLKGGMNSDLCIWKWRTHLEPWHEKFSGVEWCGLEESHDYSEFKGK